MRTRAELAVATLDKAGDVLVKNVGGLTLEEALDAAGGYRSVLGILKHTASWSHVYHSYAFEASPRHLRGIDWPRGLRDTVETSQEYVDEVIAWLDASREMWAGSLAAEPDEAFDEPRPCHWGARLPLWDIVLIMANHWSYHAGELNEILAIRRGEAWEYTEEVEENHISTAGHRIRPEWMSAKEADAYEAFRAKRDEELGRASPPGPLSDGAERE